MKFIPILTTGLIIGVIGLTACDRPQPQTISSDSPASPNSSQPPATAAQEVAQTASCTLVESGFGPQGRVSIRVEEVATGLEVPWGIAFLSDGDMLVTERPGRVRLVQNGNLRSQPVATIQVTDSGEGGLLGIAAHPEIASNRLFYVYYTADVNESPMNRVERWRLAQDGLSATRDRVILDNIPVALYHNGGRIRFGPDGMLYIGTGDARKPDISQDPSSLAGKILRVTPDGDVPADNPVASSPVYISGIRNTQGFDWFNKSTLWVTDHGPSGELGRSGHDKVSIARAGDNLGWPTIYRCESGQGFVTPSLVWRQATPPGGAAVYTGDAIPEWKGSLMVATLRSEHLHRIVFDPRSPQQVQSHEVYLQGTQGRLREAIMGPDGELYITTSNCDGRGSCPPARDKILRVTR
ncbi:PQQ-dependent sugar dehydrogenase [Leptothermofonsia sichuanensis E412]|nr:PQQ-dependent sugar dehydrogenase [Leptothermofonsia sichuanensis]QZZ19715.1 PQQ-dependent sugar dehydrogenase [Leptothermofonsia sichuanensis E412]